MSKGVVLIANNNGHIDYVKQAIFLSKRIKHYLDLPVSLITDSPNYLKQNYNIDLFDQIIEIDYVSTDNKRFYFDGTIFHKTLMFKNQNRALSYFLSPYSETLVMDTDYIVCSDTLKSCFNLNLDLMLYKKSYDLAGHRDMHEFTYISDKSVDFYWATVLFFRKTEKNDCFFHLINHIEQNWEHYRKVYQISNTMFRNDYAFSIAINIMQGFTNSTDIVAELPGKHYFTIDKDILWKINESKMLFLVEKENHLGEYTPITTNGLDVHVMNKFSLERCINGA